MACVRLLRRKEFGLLRSCEGLCDVDGFGMGCMSGLSREHALGSMG